jgi:hypothetical protein
MHDLQCYDCGLRPISTLSCTMGVTKNPDLSLMALVGRGSGNSYRRLRRIRKFHRSLRLLSTNYPKQNTDCN